MDMKIWVGDLAAYNAGNLRGLWVDLSDDETFAWDQINAHMPDADEVWVMDLEGFGPLAREMNVGTAIRIAQFVEDAESNGIPQRAALEWLDWTGYGVDDFDTLAEAYAGVWVSREDFAYDFAVDTGQIDPESFAGRYFSAERYAQTLFTGDFFDTKAPAGMIYVFRSI